MARSMWKASLCFAGEDVPVKLYAAVEDRAVHFRLLHASDHVPVRQRMVDPRSGDEVPAEAVRRGVELEPGMFVLLSPSELSSMEPEPSRSIEVLRFVPAHAIDVGWYRRPYFLGPDGRAEDYFALTRALEKSGRLGIARWSMRRKRYYGVLAPHGEHLSLVSLSSVDEVVPISQLSKPDGTALNKGERRLAEQLVSTLDAAFEPAELRDEHRERLQQLISAKAQGRSIEFREQPVPAPPEDLSEALRESVRAAKERRVA